MHWNNRSLGPKTLSSSLAKWHAPKRTNARKRRSRAESGVRYFKYRLKQPQLTYLGRSPFDEQYNDPTGGDSRRAKRTRTQTFYAISPSKKQISKRLDDLSQDINRIWKGYHDSLGRLKKSSRRPIGNMRKSVTDWNWRWRSD